MSRGLHGRRLRWGDRLQEVEALAGLHRREPRSSLNLQNMSMILHEPWSGHNRQANYADAIYLHLLCSTEGHIRTTSTEPTNSVPRGRRA
jgi:hypothetical protein